MHLIIILNASLIKQIDIMEENKCNKTSDTKDIPIVKESTCAKKTLQKYNIRDGDIEAKQLSSLIFVFARGDVVKQEMIDGMVDKTVNAFNYYLDCVINKK